MPEISIQITDEMFEELTKMVEDKDAEPTFATVEEAAFDILEYHLCGPDEEEELEAGEDATPESRDDAE